MPISAIQDSDDKQYVIPVNVLLKYFDLDVRDLSNESINIPVSLFKMLIDEILGLSKINEENYLAAYPDVRGALLAGEILSGREHFSKTGYYEQRVPGALPFDPEWYHGHYKDIAQTFDRDQETEMYKHFRTRGYFEGRAGTEKDFLVLQKWAK